MDSERCKRNHKRTVAAWCPPLRKGMRCKAHATCRQAVVLPKHEQLQAASRTQKLSIEVKAVLLKCNLLLTM